MIVLEGMDNSGKSTLAKRFGLEVVHPGPAPRTRYEELVCLDKQLREARDPIVHDRITCISSQVYGVRSDLDTLNRYLQDMITTPHCVIIYCRPDINVISDFSTHKIEPHDDLNKLAEISSKVFSLVAKYDKLMSNIPHLTYDWTKDEIDLSQIEFTQFNRKAWNSWLKDIS